MINLGLSPADTALYYELLHTSHRVHVVVQMLNTQHQVLKDCTPLMVDGTVDIDADADITRSLALRLLDPEFSLGLDSPNSQMGMSTFSRYFRVYYGIAPMDDPGRMFYCPIFTGPVTDVTRDGIILNIESQGKEIFSKEGAFRAKTWPAFTARTAIFINYVRDIVGDAAVANLVSDPAHGTSPVFEPWSIEQGDDVWTKLKELLYPIGIMAYYDASGYATLKLTPYMPCFTFDESYITTPVSTDFDTKSVKNAVRVTGGTPTGMNGRYAFEAVLQPSHPFSPQSLALRPGVPRYIAEFIQDDSLTDPNWIKALATNRLSEILYQTVNPSFSSFVVPTLEEGDIFTISTPQFWGQARFSKATIPLMGDGEMSVGFLSTSVSQSTMFTGAKITQVASPTKIPVPPKPKKTKKKKNKTKKKKQNQTFVLVKK